MLENLPVLRDVVSDSSETGANISSLAFDPTSLRYRLLFEMNVDGILLVTHEGKVLDANVAACTLLQVGKEDLAVATNLITELNRQSISLILETVKRAGRFRGKLQMVRRDTRVISVEAYCTSYRAENGQEQTCVTFHEVADTSSSDEVVFQLAPVLESSNEAIMAMNLEGVILTWNSGAEQLFGIPAAEMKGRYFKDVTPGWLHDDIQSAFKKILRGQYASPLEMDYERSDGQNMNLTLSFSPINDAVGRVVGMSGMAHDVTNRKQKEQVLEQAEREYRGLFEHAQDAIVIFDPDGELILDVNERACELYGYSRDELVGMSLEDLTHDVLHGKSQIELTLNTGASQRFQTLQYRRDGTLVNLDISAAVVSYQGRRAILSINRDITEFKRLEDALRELSIRDELTKLYNRREMSRIVTEEIERCKRYERPMSLVLVDIDWFKNVNDSYGHQAGDEILQDIARVLTENTRATDYVARYGGEEMVVILPETSIENAIVVAENLRHRIAEHPFTISIGSDPRNTRPLEINITISLGISGYTSDINTEESILIAADRALYEAKRRGRNCSVLFSMNMLNTRQLEQTQHLKPSA